MKKYILISPGSDTSKQMLLDLREYISDDFLFIDSPIKYKNSIQKRLFELYFKINAKISLPFKCVWNNMYSLSQISLNKEDEYYIILGNGNFNYYQSKWLNKLKEKYNIHYVVYFIDPLSGLTSEYMRKNIFSLETDYIYTFDYHDAKKIGAIHTMNLYSKKEISFAGRTKKNSIYFVGSNKKGRIFLLHEIWDKLIQADIKCNFNIVNVPEEMQNKNNINYNKILPYDKVLEQLQEYDCILEVLQPGQTGVTLRYYEAVAYNKKLITNNSLVKELPFYNTKYMFVFNDVDEIDVDWIKRDVDINYFYNGEFSPIKFLEEIKERVDCE